MEKERLEELAKLRDEEIPLEDKVELLVHTVAKQGESIEKLITMIGMVNISTTLHNEALKELGKELQEIKSFWDREADA